MEKRDHGYFLNVILTRCFGDCELPGSLCLEVKCVCFVHLISIGSKLVNFWLFRFISPHTNFQTVVKTPLEMTWLSQIGEDSAPYTKNFKGYKEYLFILTYCLVINFRGCKRTWIDERSDNWDTVSAFPKWRLSEINLGIKPVPLHLIRIFKK